MTRAQPFRYWLPAIAWAAVILLMSGDAASAGQSGLWFRGVFPFLTDDQFFIVHFAIRKGAHVFAYGVLGLLNFRAVRGPRQGWRGIWSALAVIMAFAVAVTDEGRQSLSLGRTGSISDVFLDVASAAGVQFLFWRKSRTRWAGAIVGSDETLPDSSARGAAGG